MLYKQAGAESTDQYRIFFTAAGAGSGHPIVKPEEGYIAANVSE
jgi:hypothetical protein